MILKFVITNENDVVVSQQIKSEHSLQKDGAMFIIKLSEYTQLFMSEFNKNNESKIKKLEVFDDNNIKILETNKNQN